MAYPDKSAYAQCIVAYCEGPGHEIKVREREGREKEEKSIEREVVRYSERQMQRGRIVEWVAGNK